MSVDIYINLSGAPEVHRRLLIVADGITDFSPALERIGSQLQKSFQINFQQEGSLFGGWPDRKPQYKDGERIDTWPLLNKTGAMKDSFVQAVTGTQLAIGNTAPYFKYHQSSLPRTRLPRRIMMKIEGSDKNFIVKAYQEYITGLIRGATDRVGDYL